MYGKCNQQQREERDVFIAEWCFCNRKRRLRRCGEVGWTCVIWSENIFRVAVEMGIEMIRKGSVSGWMNFQARRTSATTQKANIGSLEWATDRRPQFASFHWDSNRFESWRVENEVLGWMTATSSYGCLLLSARKSLHSNHVLWNVGMNKNPFFVVRLLKFRRT